jgi:hypothetical protein
MFPVRRHDDQVDREPPLTPDEANRVCRDFVLYRPPCDPFHRYGLGIAVRREKARIFSGCDSRPATGNVANNLANSLLHLDTTIPRARLRDHPGRGRQPG